jgi:hypothetical protein
MRFHLEIAALAMRTLQLMVNGAPSSLLIATTQMSTQLVTVVVVFVVDICVYCRNCRKLSSTIN